MIARQMVVRCDKCGRTFIRSMGGTQSIMRWIWSGRSGPTLCRQCQLDTPNASNTPTLGDVFKWLKKDKKL